MEKNTAINTILGVGFVGGAGSAYFGVQNYSKMKGFWEENVLDPLIENESMVELGAHANALVWFALMVIAGAMAAGWLTKKAVEGHVEEWKAE